MWIKCLRGFDGIFKLLDAGPSLFPCTIFLAGMEAVIPTFIPFSHNLFSVSSCLGFLILLTSSGFITNLLSFNQDCIPWSIRLCCFSLSILVNLHTWNESTSNGNFFQTRRQSFSEVRIHSKPTVIGKVLPLCFITNGSNYRICAKVPLIFQLLCLIHKFRLCL